VEKNCIDENWNQRKASLVSRVREFLASPIDSVPQAAISGEVSNQRLEEGIYKHEMVKQCWTCAGSLIDPCPPSWAS